MESNKVSVIIYGQEYVVAGHESAEHIIKVADYVDTKIHEVERVVKGTAAASSLAVLSAVNVADEYFTALDTISDLKKKNEQLQNDVQHYVQMWEEAKRSFVQYKEDAQDTTRQKEALQGVLDEKEKEISRIKAHLSEVESGFFDLQMENVQLKSEVERFKKIMV